MPSRQPPSPAAPPLLHHRHHHHTSPKPSHLIAPLTATATTISLLLILAILYRKLTRKRTAPAPPSDHQHNQHHLRRFPFHFLRRATSSFSTQTRLGQGGFGSVYRGIVQSTNETFAVKVMDYAGSLQGEREFQNELAVATRLNAFHTFQSTSSEPFTADSKFVVSILGYSTDKRGLRKLIVYELMENGSLQDKLLDQKSEELMEWRKRFTVVLDVAKGLRFLHTGCGHTPVIHGDVKASNVLLDGGFNAKLGDFGLARVLDEEDDKLCRDECGGSLILAEGCGGGEDVVNGGGSVVEDSESVVTGFVELERSPESCTTRTIDEEGASPVLTTEVELETVTSCVSESCGTDKVSVVEESGNRKGMGKKKDDSGRYWWWKQENSGGGGGGGGVGSESGRIKDYVMEWIRNEIKKERPKSTEWTTKAATAGGGEVGVGSTTADTSGGGGDENATTLRQRIEPKRKQWKRFNWLSSSLDHGSTKKEKDRVSTSSCRKPPREWWREEFCEELTRKKAKKKKNREKGSEMWWQREDDFAIPDQKRRRKSITSLGSIDWWLDGLSSGGGGGEISLRSGRRNSQDWSAIDSTTIPKSGGGISSTPSMRGTVCYIAPEYNGGNEQLSTKCDVYSFGVLVLVIISGRRPLQVMASPMSEFERANLISWARQLAHNGKLLDLVDPLIQSLDKEEVLMCITIALLCLQRSPGKRPNMKEVVDMLSRKMEVPDLPFEFSQSPPSNFPFKSRKKGR